MNKLQLPNILWIGVDQMRWDTPGCSGNEICRTPHIDKLAEGGVRFRNAYTTCPLCTPARASMFTGQFAFHHGMGTNCDMYHSMSAELANPELMLHQRLASVGYECGYTGKWHVGTNLGPSDYGFQGMSLPGYGDLKQTRDYDEYLDQNQLSYGEVIAPIYGNPGGVTLLGGQWNGPVESTPDYYLANHTMAMLSQYAKEGKPFFHTCQFWAPHPPYLPAGEFVGMHDRDSIKPWLNYTDDYRDKPEQLRRFRSNFYRNLPDNWAGWAQLIGLCYDYTALVDAQIGRIMAHLHKLGLEEDTILIFSSDHGDMIGSHGGLFDKGFLYQEAMRIPLIVAWKGHFLANRTSDQLVYNMDIMPTVLDAIGIPADNLDGQSFLSSLKDGGSGAAKQRSEIYLEFHGLRYLHTQRAVVTGDGYKYIWNPGDQDEYYDLHEDPGELRNLINDPRCKTEVKRIQDILLSQAFQHKDPVADYIAKIFGNWRSTSGQPDASQQNYTGRIKRFTGTKG